MRLKIFLGGALAMMSTQAVVIQHPVRVAIVGAGVSGCQIASTLASFKGDDGSPVFDVSIFEKGRGCGGRASSRRYKKKSIDLVFDHGASSIEAKTPQFAKVLSHWHKSGFVEPWNARYANIKISDPSTTTSSNALISENIQVNQNLLFVPSPSFSSLGHSLLDMSANHNPIKTYFGADVIAERQADESWLMIDKNKRENIGHCTFDWLVSSDRNFCDVFEASTKELPQRIATFQDNFMKPLDKSILNAPLLSVMLCYDQHAVSDWNFDAARITGHPVLSYISIESSKPSRVRSDSTTLIVLHSTHAFAEQLIERVNHDVRNDGTGEEPTKEKIRAAVALAAEEPLLKAFNHVIRDYFNVKKPGLGLGLETPFFIKGQRWSAASPKYAGGVSHSTFLSSFPQKSFLETGSHLSYIDTKLNFAAVGDYFGNDDTLGTVEAACLSGIAGARGIYNTCLQGGGGNTQK